MTPGFEDYAIDFTPLTAEEHDGFLAAFPNPPGCAAHGRILNEGLAEARGAVLPSAEARREWRRVMANQSRRYMSLLLPWAA